jgi:hypothetical protein
MHAAAQSPLRLGEECRLSSCGPRAGRDTPFRNEGVLLMYGLFISREGAVSYLPGEDGATLPNCSGSYRLIALDAVVHLALIVKHLVGGADTITLTAPGSDME